MNGQSDFGSFCVLFKYAHKVYTSFFKKYDLTGFAEKYSKWRNSEWKITWSQVAVVSFVTLTMRVIKTVNSKTEISFSVKKYRMWGYEVLFLIFKNKFQGILYEFGLNSI